MPTIEVKTIPVDFPSTDAGKVSIVNIDLVPVFNGATDYIVPPTAVLPCYPAGTPNSYSLEGRVVESNILRVGLRNNTAGTINPGPIDITFIFLRE